MGPSKQESAISIDALGLDLLRENVIDILYPVTRGFDKHEEHCSDLVGFADWQTPVVTSGDLGVLLSVAKVLLRMSSMEYYSVAAEP